MIDAWIPPPRGSYVMVWCATWVLGFFKTPLLVIKVQLRLRTAAKTPPLLHLYIIAKLFPPLANTSESLSGSHSNPV